MPLYADIISILNNFIHLSYLLPDYNQIFKSRIKFQHEKLKLY